MSKQSGSPRVLPIPPLALLMLCMLLASFCSWLMPSFKIELPLALPVAVLFGSLGIAFSLAGVITFRAAATSVNPSILPPPSNLSLKVFTASAAIPCMWDFY